MLLFISDDTDCDRCNALYKENRGCDCPDKECELEAVGGLQECLNDCPVLSCDGINNSVSFFREEILAFYSDRCETEGLAVWPQG